MSRRIPPEKTTTDNSTNPSLLAEDYDAPCTRSNSELFSTKNKPLNHMCGCNFSEVWDQKEEERTCNGNLCFGQLPQSNKCNLSKTRCIKNFDVNDETRSGSHKMWLLHSQPGKQGQECHHSPA